MADITSAVEQDQIAESLLGDSEQQPMEQGDYDRSLAGVIDRGDEEEQEYGEEYGEEAEGQADDREQINADLQAELEQLQNEEYLQQQEQEGQQPQELTPQAVQEAVQQLDQVVNEFGLNDPTEAAILGSSLGLDAANSAPLGQVMSKTTLSALQILEQCGGDLSKVGAIPREGAVAFANDFLRAVGVDPRMSETDPEDLASVVLGGTLNFLSAVNTYGLGASLDVLNSPEGSLWFASNLLQCIGGGGPVDREGALRLADAGGRYILSVLQRLDAQRGQQPERSRGSGRASSGSRRATTSRFRTNQDLFDSESEAIYAREHGRL